MHVHWLEQSESNVPAGHRWLSAAEAQYLAGIRFEKRRADWRLGRWTAKRAVAAYLNLPDAVETLAEIEIRPAPSGAPEVFWQERTPGVSISLSHRAGVSICAVAPSAAALGCDLERIEARSDAFAADYFTAEEQELVGRAPAADRSRLLALLWSAKESALKALRLGLRLDTRSVAVSLTAANSACTWHPMSVRVSDGKLFQGWWLRTFTLLRTVIADPPPAPPILLNKDRRTQ